MPFLGEKCTLVGRHGSALGHRLVTYNDGESVRSEFFLALGHEMTENCSHQALDLERGRALEPSRLFPNPLFELVNGGVTEHQGL